MPRVDLVRATPTPKSFRAASVQGMFDIPAADEQVFRLSVEADFPDEWSVGLVVGPSGAGKSTLARELWPEAVTEPPVWRGACILDDFPAGMEPREITSLLAAVGLSSPPAWLRPYRVLSTGQQFRADLARALAERTLVVFDEYTSVVDRTVAKAASVAVAKHVRRTGKRFVAVTCHYDVAEWLEADWVLDLASGTLRRDRLRRPPIEMAVHEGDRATWPLFRSHHYMTASLSPSCRVFLAYVTLDGVERLAGFFSLMPAAGLRGWWRGHRTVVLPDFQGLGIGNRMIEATAEALWTKERKRFRATTSAPGLIHYRRKHPDRWKCVRGVSMTQRSGSGFKTAAGRLTTSWEYIPESLRQKA